MEQTSHHPPITHVLMEGPPHLPYKLYGYLEFKLGVKGAFTAAVFSAPGRITLELPNKAVFDITTKTVEVTGLLYKEKHFNVTNTMQITDK